MVWNVLMPLFVAVGLTHSDIEHRRMNFEEAFDRTMDFEGGGVVHTVSGDPGGTTKWGISQRAYPDVDIANLSKEDAMRLARRDYWVRVHADRLPAELRGHVFDTAFNMGVERAGYILQHALNLYSLIEGHDPVTIDGDIGPQTLEAVGRYPADRLTTLFRYYRSQRYVSLAESGRGKFLFGWLKRV